MTKPATAESDQASTEFPRVKRQRYTARRIPQHVTNQLTSFANGSLPGDAKLGFQAVGIIAGRSRNSLYRDIANGLLHPIKTGTNVYFSAADVRRYLDGGLK